MTNLDEKRLRSRSTMVNTGSTLVIIALFAVAALVLMAAGLQVYKNVVLAANENFELRTSLSYVATKVRQADRTGMVSVRDVDGTQVLALGEYIDDEYYETLIYFADGALYELLQPGDWEPELDFGFESMEIDSFSFSQEGNVITLTSGNAGGETESLSVVLRSAE